MTDELSQALHQACLELGNDEFAVKYIGEAATDTTSTSDRDVFLHESRSGNVNSEGGSGISIRNGKYFSEIDNAEMVLIPSGTFEMGNHDDNPFDNSPVHTVYLDAFYIDVALVTNAMYKKFVTTQAEFWNDPNFNQPNQPVIDVDWFHAMAFARWAGKRSPTEAEWEYAARGGLVGKKYSWGNEPPVSGMIFKKYGANFEEAKIGRTTLVRSYPPNGYGLYDIAGNAGEWCLDEYQVDFYTESPKKNPFAGENMEEVINNAAKVRTERVSRGGAWLSSRDFLPVSFRIGVNPFHVDNVHSFRCVLDSGRTE